MKLGIRSKLFLVSVGVIAASVLTADAYLTQRLDQSLTERVESDLLVRSRMAAREASLSDAGPNAFADWDRLADELGSSAACRVTIIRSDGNVLGDSGVDTTAISALENHADREEVREALRDGSGASARSSATVGRRMMYVAVPFESSAGVSGVTRMAVELTGSRALAS